MTKLGSYPGSVVVRTLENAGWRITRQKGSHVVMEKAGHEATLSIPVHKGKDVKRGTLRSIIRDAGLTVDDFLSNL